MDQINTNLLAKDSHYKEELLRIMSYPLMMSFPRSGAHWINAVTELYLDRPRLPEVRATWLEGRDDYLWYHDHDIGPTAKLQVNHNNVLYLYRDPVEVIYSWLVYEYSKGQGINSLSSYEINIALEESMSLLRGHLVKWLLSPYTARIAVRYENFVKAPCEEFKKVCEFFDVDFNEEKALWCFNVVTKEALAKRRTEPHTISDLMLTGEYAMDRVRFKKQFGALIKKTIILKELEPFFG